jgi:hypothetical protein
MDEYTRGPHNGVPCPDPDNNRELWDWLNEEGIQEPVFDWHGHYSHEAGEDGAECELSKMMMERLLAFAEEPSKAWLMTEARVLRRARANVYALSRKAA